MTGDPRSILFHRHRFDRWVVPLWVIVTGLVLDNVLVYANASARAHLVLAGGVLLAAFAAKMLFRPSLQDTARRLDASASTRNRFEAIASLEGINHPLARALNDETGDFLFRRQLPPAYMTIVGMVLLVAFAVIRLATLKTGREAAEPERITAAPVAANQEEPPKQTPMPLAALSWLEPASSIVATQSELVPLLAKANSSAALKNVKLHVMVGAELVQVTPLESVGAGEHRIQCLLDLGKLKCEPYSFVGYYLSAELSREGVTPDTPPWPELFSTLQLIQIRPAGSDLTAGPPPADEAASSELERLLYAVKRAKVAQVEVAAASFELAHGQPPAIDPAWRAKMKETATKERAIWQNDKELLAAVKDDLALWSAIDLLHREGSELEATWDSLGKNDPAAAVGSSQRALAKIAELEQVFATALAKQQEAKSILLNDTLTEDGVLKLPARDGTPAGLLERDAREQQTLANELAKRTATTANAFSTEKEVVNDLTKLAANEGFSTEVRSLVSSAVVDAREARQHLNDRDQRAATEPAARAAQALQASVNAMEASGRQSAARQLASAQRELNEAALAEKDGDSASAERTLEKIRAQVAQEALAQQRSGSAEAAKELAELHDALRKPPKRDNRPLSKGETPPGAGEQLSELARLAAEKRQQVLSDKEREQELAKASEELRRVRQNVKRSAQNSPKDLEELFKQAQENAQKSGTSLNLPPPKENPPPKSNAEEKDPAKGTVSDTAIAAAPPVSKTDDPVRKVIEGRPSPSAVNRERYVDGLILEIDRAMAQLGQKRAAERTQVLSTASVADAPEPYRKAVGDYFEALARAGQAESVQSSTSKR
ncbi:MAG: hypothetical protein QM715_12060 [Nibricoccus sp.]